MNSEKEKEKSVNFIKTDNDTIINEKCIRWVKKMDQCLAVCSKPTGCNINTMADTHKICKANNPESYEKLNKFFK